MIHTSMSILFKLSMHNHNLGGGGIEQFSEIANSDLRKFAIIFLELIFEI